MISFKNPIFFIGVFIFVLLALYVVGYTSKYASPKAQIEYYQKELENYYLSDKRNFRDSFVGVIALLLGLPMLYILSTNGESLLQNLHVFIVSIIFTSFGIMRLFPNHITSEEVKIGNKAIIKKLDSPPKFYWSNTAFKHAIIFKDYERAEQILLERSKSSDLTPQQKNIFINHGLYWIKKAKKENIHPFF